MSFQSWPITDNVAAESKLGGDHAATPTFSDAKARQFMVHPGRRTGDPDPGFGGGGAGAGGVVKHFYGELLDAMQRAAALGAKGRY